MRLRFLTVGLLLLLALLIVLMSARTDAARFRSSFRSRFRVRIGRTGRFSRYRYSYSGPVYSRRLSPALMGPLYFSYASRYPLYFHYRRIWATEGSGDVCTNNLALSNGSHVGTFRCPFLPDEPSGWVKCCGYENEEFCCDPAYDDSWKLAVGLSAVAIVAIVGACLLALGFVLFLIICCCVKKRSGGISSPTLGSSSAAAAKPEVGVSNPVKPPYPTMEYGTVQPPVAGAPGSAPYPPMAPPYPPPYSAQN